MGGGCSTLDSPSKACRQHWSSLPRHGDAADSFLGGEDDTSMGVFIVFRRAPPGTPNDPHSFGRPKESPQHRRAAGESSSAACTLWRVSPKCYNHHPCTRSATWAAVNTLNDHLTVDSLKVTSGMRVLPKPTKAAIRAAHIVERTRRRAGRKAESVSC